VDPDDTITLARYLDYARAALEDIWSRDRLPILAGGSGQYVWALLEGWRPPRVPPDMELRARLQEEATRYGPEVLHSHLAALDPDAATRLDPRNARRVIRALEVVMRTGQTLAACQARVPLDADVLVLGLSMDREEHYRRLDERVEAMVEAGLIAEVEGLRERGYGDTIPVRGAICYHQVSEHLDGLYDLGEAVRRMKNANHRLARRQGAWFRANDPRIAWIKAGPAAKTTARDRAEKWLRNPAETA
jgi:tRNA dimethylallyltransferase